MQKLLEKFPVATALVLVYAVVGGVVVITGGELSFKEYMESMSVAAGGLAIGRGFASK